MDRYNEVKLLLKKWEQGFVAEHQRKPGKVTDLLATCIRVIEQQCQHRLFCVVLFAGHNSIIIYDYFDM